MKNRWEEWKKKYWPPKKDQLLILVLLGLLLAVIVFPAEPGEKEEKEQEVMAAAKSKEAEGEEYGSRMEQKLEDLLGTVEGVGEVRVMLTFVGSGEKKVEKDQTTGESQQSVETVYEEHGSSERTPYVTSETNPKVEGVLVIAEGGGNANVQKEILEAAQALFGIDAHKIKIMKMEGTQ